MHGVSRRVEFKIFLLKWCNRLVAVLTASPLNFLLVCPTQSLELRCCGTSLLSMSVNNSSSHFNVSMYLFVAFIPFSNPFVVMKRLRMHRYMRYSFLCPSGNSLHFTCQHSIVFPCWGSVFTHESLNVVHAFSIGVTYVLRPSTSFL